MCPWRIDHRNVRSGSTWLLKVLLNLFSHLANNTSSVSYFSIILFPAFYASLKLSLYASRSSNFVSIRLLRGFTHRRDYFWFQDQKKKVYLAVKRFLKSVQASSCIRSIGLRAAACISRT